MNREEKRLLKYLEGDQMSGVSDLKYSVKCNSCGKEWFKDHVCKTEDEEIAQLKSANKDLESKLAIATDALEFYEHKSQSRVARMALEKIRSANDS